MQMLRPVCDSCIINAIDFAYDVSAILYQIKGTNCDQCQRLLDVWTSWPSTGVCAAVQWSWLVLMGRTPSPAVLSSSLSTAHYLQLESRFCEAGDWWITVHLWGLDWISTSFTLDFYVHLNVWLECVNRHSAISVRYIKYWEDQKTNYVSVKIHMKKVIQNKFLDLGNATCF